MGRKSLFGFLGKSAATTAGGTAGYMAFCSSTVFSLGGFAFTVSNPLGWVLLATTMCAASGYAIASLASTGGRQDGIEEQMERITSERSNEQSREKQKIANHSNKSLIAELESLRKQKIMDGKLSDQKAAELDYVISNGYVDIVKVIDILRKL